MGYGAAARHVPARGPVPAAKWSSPGNTAYYPLGETAPEHKGTLKGWAALVYRTDTRGRRRVARMVYEVATFQTLREQPRCKEIWVVGADRWRNPDEDCPPTSSHAVPSTTASRASPWTRQSSATACARR